MDTPDATVPDPGDPSLNPAEESTQRIGTATSDGAGSGAPAGTGGSAGPAGASGTGASANLAALWANRRLRVILAAAVAFVLLGSGAIWAGAATGGLEPRAVPAAGTTSTPTPTPTPTTPELRPAPAAATAASPLRTCSVADLAGDSRLGDFQAQVVNAATGEILFDRGGSTTSRAASVLKVLTSAAALSVLGPDYRATTTVVAGSEPGQIVLVGGGDLTLSSTPTGDESFYQGAAHLDALAEQARTAVDGPITSVVLDSSYFGDPGWEPSWERKEQTDGYMPEITALQVDGDRNDPYRSTSARSDDPVARAGAAFADELGGDVSVSVGTAPAGATVLASVQSQPVSVLIKQSLIVSDNALAEMLARLVAVEGGSGNTFDAIEPAVLAGLKGYGIDTTGIRIVDGSGLSDNNAVPPAYLTKLFQKINAREGNLGVIFDGLPVAGGDTGSLSYSDRFTGANADADGAVFAKTGWIDTGYTLSGIINADDGTTLTFAVYALGDVGDNAKQAIDTITTGFFRCGNNLSNN
ncbi:D-alanyl-D-alanine carboxypeptidase/D-alanyl-D-alanine-endopeptidase [Cryobacterium sp. PAMC25264]|uniref:D-alanyl-D-alanine carboxypeptidase/D-alanyl-D-alanine endopeptidase n=1 Tax=Cryobacterium sp. PAMC25264 TaxID=2861288 RepID=UPI002103A724|nr:D-alanyl-D-alanine carboxypeptidase/D-alanyl-D-alanine-endopeptidase [Cryobacterium sp. PAMC25264]